MPQFQIRMSENYKCPPNGKVNIAEIVHKQKYSHVIPLKKGDCML